MFFKVYNNSLYELLWDLVGTWDRLCQLSWRLKFDQFWQSRVRIEGYSSVTTCIYSYFWESRNHKYPLDYRVTEQVFQNYKVNLFTAFSDSGIIIKIIFNKHQSDILVKMTTRIDSCMTWTVIKTLEQNLWYKIMKKRTVKTKKKDPCDS